MIRMSKLTDYAIVLLAHLARSGGTLTAQELSERSRIPAPTVSKLFKELSKAGLVVSQRGRRGGYGLARPADLISAADIVAAIEGPIALTDCSGPGKGPCQIEDVCPARPGWDPVARVIQDALAGLPLSAISAHRVEPAAPAPVTVLTGVHAS
jgi:FeS assembly SUF system regulator